VDIRKYNFDGEWLTFAVESKVDIGELKFKVQPVGSSDFEKAAKSFDEMTDLCSRAIIDWNLTDGDHPLKCTAENKQKYLSKFLIFVVKTFNGQPVTETIDGEEVPVRRNIAGLIMKYASDPNNFLKN
jgi:hypothetical protein